MQVVILKYIHHIHTICIMRVYNYLTITGASSISFMLTIIFEDEVKLLKSLRVADKDIIDVVS